MDHGRRFKYQHLHHRHKEQGMSMFNLVLAISISLVLLAYVFGLTHITQAKTQALSLASDIGETAIRLRDIGHATHEMKPGWMQSTTQTYLEDIGAIPASLWSPSRGEMVTPWQGAITLSVTNNVLSFVITGIPKNACADVVTHLRRVSRPSRIRIDGTTIYDLSDDLDNRALAANACAPIGFRDIEVSYVARR